MPSALKEVKSKEAAKEKPKTKIDLRLVRETEDRAKQWMEANNKLEGDAVGPLLPLRPGTLHELSGAFRAEGRRRNPQWYNDGAEFLLKSQNEGRKLERPVRHGARHGLRRPFPHALHARRPSSSRRSLTAKAR